ncbi:MAG: hypothetical protein RBS80_08660 [Thermoguttaceae bacterium]|jgi:hypothetical protein|nr:hypothetical protein [Thermoguttaceae bacterium]
MRRTIILLAFALASPVAAETIRLPVVFDDAAGCRVTARRAELLGRVPTSGPDGTVVIDGRNPTRFSRDPRQVERTEDGLLNSEFLRYDFHVQEPGTYTVFVRAALPPGRSRFVEVLDGRRYAGPSDEENTGESVLTKWIERPKVRLSTGLHRLSLASAGYQMPGIEAIVLASEGDAADAVRRGLSQFSRHTGQEARSIEGSAAKMGLSPSHEAEKTVRDNVREQSSFHEIYSVEVQTLPLDIPGLRSVKALHGLPDGATLQWSLPDSDQRHPMPGDGLPVTGPVRFHLTLDAAHPAAGPLSAEVEIEPGAVLRLEQGGKELWLDARTGDFLMLYDRKNDRLLAGASGPQPLAAVQFKRAGEALWTEMGPERTAVLKPKEQYALGPWHLETVSETEQRIEPEFVRLHDGAAEISHVFTAEGLGRARVTQRIAPAGEDRAATAVWNLDVTVEVLDGPADVVGVVYPRLPAVRIGECGLDDVQLRMMSFGHRAVQPGRSALHDASYCGRVVMNWTQVYDEEASLYLGIHDPRGTTTVHGSEPGGPEGETVGLSTRRLDEIRPGESATWSVRLAAGSGGWHQGARLYGDWLTSVHGPADYPDWLRTSPGWLDLNVQNYGAGFRFDQLPGWLTRAKAIGFDWVQVWGQFSYEFGTCCSAWYGPSPLYGGAEGWQQATVEIKRREGRIGGYFIYDRFDKLPVWLGTFLGRFTKDDYPDDVPWDTAEFQHEVAAVTDPSGKVPPLEPTGEDLTQYKAAVAENRALAERGERASAVQWWQTAYLPDPKWRAYLTHWVADQYAGRWGANTAYIDVLGTGNATIDYDPRRGNNGDGSWGIARKWLAKEVLDRARAHDPQFGLTMEGLGDLPGLYAAAMCSGVYRGDRNVVRYTFPDRVLIHGMANSGGHGTGGPWERYLATFREGMRWDIVGQPNSLPVSLLNLTRPFLPELYQARFLDTEGLQTSDPRIEARRFDATETALRCHIITLTNAERVSGELRLVDKELRAAGTILGLTLDGRLLKVQTAQGDCPNFRGTEPVEPSMAGSAAKMGLSPSSHLALPIDPDLLAAVLLIPQAGDDRAPAWPVLWADWSEGNGPLKLFVFNLADRPRDVAVDLHCIGYTEPYGERLPEAGRMRQRQEVSIAAREAAVIPIHSPEAAVEAWRKWTTRWSVALPAHEHQREQLLTPLLLDPTFDLPETEQHEAPFGRAVELGPTTEGYQHRRLDVWLLPGRRYRIAFQSKRTGFQADVRGSLLRLTRRDGSLEDHRWALDPKRPNEWQELGGEFTTPADLTGASLYLYNVRSPDTAWFGDIRLE